MGLPLSKRFGEVDDTVVGDTDTQQVKWLEATESYVGYVPSSMIAGALAAGRYRASSTPKSCTDVPRSRRV